MCAQYVTVMWFHLRLLSQHLYNVNTISSMVFYRGHSSALYNCKCLDLFQDTSISVSASQWDTTALFRKLLLPCFSYFMSSLVFNSSLCYFLIPATGTMIVSSLLNNTFDSRVSFHPSRTQTVCHDSHLYLLKYYLSLFL